MIDVQFHPKGEPSERRRLPAVPVAGSYLFSEAPAGRLWQVAAVVFGAKLVEVFAVEVSPMLAGELVEAWATWGEAGQTSP